MTELRKTLVRRTAGTYDHKRRRIVVMLMPGDVLAMREERTRRVFSAPLARVLRQIIVWNVDAERAAKRAARTAGRNARGTGTKARTS